MSGGAPERLGATCAALSAALDKDDIVALERAMADMAPALNAVGAPGAWHASDENRALLKGLAGQLDIARVRIAVLGDLTRRRLDQLAVAGVAMGGAGTYSR